MAFKSLNEYNTQKYKNLFVLREDGKYADVVILYRSIADVMIVDAHYIKSDEYSGYVHCCEEGCPACAKGIKLQNRIFIPVYNIKEDEIQFFDRTTYFETQLNADIFNNFPNPSEYVFRITRHGASGDRDTKYDFRAIGTLPDGLSYDSIMAKFNASFPDYYEKVVRQYSSDRLASMLSGNSTDVSGLTEYKVTPRVSPSIITNVEAAPIIPPIQTVVDNTSKIDATEVYQPLPEYTPDADSDSVGTVDTTEEVDDDVKF